MTAEERLLASPASVLASLRGRLAEIFLFEDLSASVLEGGEGGDKNGKGGNLIICLKFKRVFATWYVFTIYFCVYTGSTGCTVTGVDNCSSSSVAVSSFSSRLCR